MRSLVGRLDESKLLRLFFDAVCLRCALATLVDFLEDLTTLLAFEDLEVLDPAVRLAISCGEAQ